MPERYDLDALQAHDETVTTGLDPRLQHLAIRARRQRSTGVPEAAPAVERVAVIARVTDVSRWAALDDVEPGLVVPRQTPDGDDIVTGRIPLHAIEDVRRQPFVVSMKAAHPVRRQLGATVPDLGCDALPAASKSNGAQGVIVGVVDFGCDFVHDNFRNAGGGTRLLAIWDQNAAPAPGGAVRYGRVYESAQIDAALLTADPYTALGYAVAASESDGADGAHGTHVLDIAAGNGRGSKQPGVAHEAGLIFVDLSSSDVPQSGPASVNHGIGDSVHLVEAVHFIFDRAGTTPCVVNVSLASNSGPHDGTSLVELALDRIAAQQPNRSIVIAAGNSFSDDIHASGALAQGGAFDLNWEIPGPNTGNNEAEIWYSGRDRFDVEILAPGSRSMLVVKAGQTHSLLHGSSTAIQVASRLNDPNNHDNQIGFLLDKGLPAGTWTVRLHGASVQSGAFHAWIERNDANPSTFTSANASSHTLGSLACGRNTIAVGAYDAHATGAPPSFLSSAGPTRDGRSKPDVSAPGQDVVAARSRTRNGVTVKSGTSMAAPAVAGVVALLLAEARAAGQDLSASTIRDMLIATARLNPPDPAGWHPQYGNGRVSASGAITRQLAGGVPAVVPATQ
jgi:subtilisin family serine protease